MIGQKDFRRKGYGFEILQMMEFLAVSKLSMSKLVAKIGFQNEASIGFFKKHSYCQISKSSSEVVFSKSFS